MMNKTASIYRFYLHCRSRGLPVILDCLCKNYEVCFVRRVDDMTEILVRRISVEAIVVGTAIQ